MSQHPLAILFEDNHCVAVCKPAGVMTTGYQGKAETLDRLVKRYLKEKYRKPGNVFLGVVHRLDKPVSGVLLFARTSKAAARLSEQFREATIEKVYWAVVAGVISEPTGTLRHWLKKHEEAARIEVVPPRTPSARQAVLEFQRKGGNREMTWLELRPQTGRKHQIRVQLASSGHPIIGDTKYGSGQRFPGGIALHARSLTFLHPIRGEPITLTADPPETWRRFHSLGIPVKR